MQEGNGTMRRTVTSSIVLLSSFLLFVGCEKDNPVRPLKTYDVRVELYTQGGSQAQLEGFISIDTTNHGFFGSYAAINVSTGFLGAWEARATERDLIDIKLMSPEGTQEHYVKAIVTYGNVEFADSTQFDHWILIKRKV